MRITSQSLPKPWESKIQGPPTAKNQKAESPEAAVDTFAASAKDKHEFPLVGAALLTLTAVAGFATSGATTPQQLHSNLEAESETIQVQARALAASGQLAEEPEDYWRQRSDLAWT